MRSELQNQRTELPIIGLPEQQRKEVETWVADLEATSSFHRAMADVMKVEHERIANTRHIRLVRKGANLQN